MKCRKCHTEKKLDAFRLIGEYRDSTCKKCRNLESAEYRRTKPVVKRKQIEIDDDLFQLFMSLKAGSMAHKARVLQGYEL